MRKMTYIIIGLVCFFSSCDPCENTVECPLWYEFTLPFKVENLIDTISVGDTFQVLHSVPRFLSENNNGVDYDLSSLFNKYDTDVSIDISRLFGKEIFGTNKEDLSVHSIDGYGSIECIATGEYCFNRISFEENDDGLFFKCKVVVKKAGLYWLSYSYGRDQVERYANIDSTCCQRYHKVEFKYSFNEGEGNNQDWLGQDSIWHSDGGIERNMNELIDRFDPFVFYVKE